MLANDRVPRSIFLIGECDDWLIPGVLPLATVINDKMELDLMFGRPLLLLPAVRVNKVGESIDRIRCEPKVVIRVKAKHALDLIWANQVEWIRFLDIQNSQVFSHHMAQSIANHQLHRLDRHKS